jgi:hypothetical protein
VYGNQKGIESVDVGSASPIPQTYSGPTMVNAAAESAGANPLGGALIGMGGELLEQRDSRAKEKSRRAGALWDAELEHTLQMKRMAAQDAMKRIEQKASSANKLEEREAIRDQELGWEDADAENSGAFGPYAQDVATYASQYGIPPAVLSGVLAVESGFDPKAIGDGGNSVGMGQLYTKGALADLGLTKEEVLAMTPQQQIELTAKFLAKKVEQAGGDLWEGVGRYNGGKGNTGYQNKVRKAMRDWTGGKTSGGSSGSKRASGGLMADDGAQDPMSSPKAAQSWWGSLKTDQRAAIASAAKDMNWEVLDPGDKMTVNQRHALVDEFGTEALIAQHLGVDQAALEPAPKKKDKGPGAIDGAISWAKGLIGGDKGDDVKPTTDYKAWYSGLPKQVQEYADFIRRSNPGMSPEELIRIVTEQTTQSGSF